MRWALLGSLLLAGASSAEPSLIIGVVGALVVVWVVARGSRALAGSAQPVMSSREHRRTLARRTVPRQRDPDAPGHTRSRAPSGLLPAV